MRLVQAMLMLPAVLATAACGRQPAYLAQAGYAQPYGAAAAPPPVVEPVAPVVAQRLPAPKPTATYQVAYAPQLVGVPEQPYLLDSGDRLRVVVFGQDGVTNSYAVDANGSIAMPLIGAVPARGLTTQQLGADIAARLRQGYIREPHVAIEIEIYRPFFILGEVTYPGQYPYVANMTVETAVAIAGGFSPRAKRSEVNMTRPYGGQIARGTVPPYTPVRPGDTITVTERWF
jgi:polysaccharide export outer membrane protein